MGNTRFLLLATVSLLGAVVPARAADKAPRPAAGPVGTSVAVFNLETQAGLTDGVAKLMTEHVAALLRESSAFGRVVASADLASLVDLERQKQMANCANDSCMAELAGALGVDFLVTGSIGKLGDSYLLNIKLLDVKRAVTKGSVSERFTGKSEEALLDGVQPAVFKLLNMCGVKHTLAPQGRVGVPPSPVVSEIPPASASPQAPEVQRRGNTAGSSPVQDTPEAVTQRPGWVFPVMVGGGVVVLAGALLVLLGVATGALTGTWFAVNSRGPILPDVTGRESDFFLSMGLSVGAGVVATAALALVGFLVLGAGATAAVVAAIKV